MLPRTFFDLVFVLEEAGKKDFLMIGSISQFPNNI